MKQINIVLLTLLIIVTSIQAGPRHRNHPRPVRYSYYPHHHSGYYPYRSSYWGVHYYSPVVVRTYTTTRSTSHQELVTLTAEMIAEDIMRMNSMMNQGLLSEKEYERGKKTLLNRIGMQINPQSSELNTAEVLDQIEVLYQMRSSQLITKKEYDKQKTKLLAIL